MADETETLTYCWKMIKKKVLFEVIQMIKQKLERGNPLTSELPLPSPCSPQVSDSKKTNNISIDYNSLLVSFTNTNSDECSKQKETF